MLLTLTALPTAQHKVRTGEGGWELKVVYFHFNIMLHAQNGALHSKSFGCASFRCVGVKGRGNPFKWCKSGCQRQVVDML